MTWTIFIVQIVADFGKRSIVQTVNFHFQMRNHKLQIKNNKILYLKIADCGLKFETYFCVKWSASLSSVKRTFIFCSIEFLVSRSGSSVFRRFRNLRA